MTWTLAASRSAASVESLPQGAVGCLTWTPKHYGSSCQLRQCWPGLDVKQAQGRLPGNFSLITFMLARLWQQVFQPVWARVLAPWLQMQKMESNAQEARVDTSGHQKFSNTLAARAIVLRSQVWVGCLVADYQLIEFEGRMLYEFRTTPQLQNSWPLSEKASALVHTLMHLTRASDRMFPGRSLTCHAYKLQGECAVCFLSSASAL
eukprot:16947-Heterococcus_DN1.PRE.2